MASPRGACDRGKGVHTSGYQRGFFTVARSSGGGWGSCGQRRTRPMTRARALKQVIRARIAKTGERYTTARRMVLKTLPGTTATPLQPVQPSAPKAATRTAIKPKTSISDAKFREKTGHGLDHWFELL